jgi:hypothetical protein
MQEVLRISSKRGENSVTLGCHKRVCHEIQHMALRAIGAVINVQQKA